MQPGGMGQEATRTSKIFSIAMVGVLAVGFTVAALRSEPNHATQVDLNDAGIWLSRASEATGGQIGRLNAELELVDALLNVGTLDFDLHQWGSTVLIQAGERIMSVDVRLPQLRPESELPVGSQLRLGGETAVVFEPVGGALWIGDGITIGTNDYAKVEPSMRLEGVDEVIVGIGGTIYATRRSEGTVSRVQVGAEEAVVMAVDELSPQATLTLVGSQPVFLDGSRVIFNDVTVDLSAYGEQFRLQEPGPQAPGVIVSTETHLLQIDFEEAVAIEFTDAGTGAPVTPVVAGGCSYGAWQTIPTAAEYCQDGRESVYPVPGIEPDTPLKFRVNHNRVALNDLPNGVAFLFTGGEPAVVTDWSQALSNQDNEVEDETSEFNDQVVADRPVCNREGNVPPNAVDDPDIVTRAGRPIVIRPLANDTDDNCDVLTIELGELPPDIGEVALIEGNRAIQYSPPPERLVEVAIPYRASDGIESDGALITVSFRAVETEGSPPNAVPDRTFVTQGKTVTHNVLVNDTDPDGDALAVQSIGLPSAGIARFRPDGQIVYTAPADFVGPAVIPYVLVDETGKTDETGQLTVDVTVSTTNTLPIARSDHGAGFVGDTIVVDVLANDSDADGDTLTLVKVTQQPGVTLDYNTGTVALETVEPGTHRLEYEVTDGRSSETVVGSLRFDAVARTGDNQPPIAVRDDVVVVPGVPLVFDVLANDFEPDGDVLVVQAVQDVPRELTVEILERSLLRITANMADTSSTVEFRYRIHDGKKSATGLVVVRPVLVGGDNQAPVLASDTAEAHAGGVVSIPVLDNDYDPDGDILILEDAFVREPQGIGRFVAQGEVLRFLAPTDFRGTVTGTYTVFDGFNRVSETVRVRVKDPETDGNIAPRPPDITARTFAGKEIHITLPLDRMDPDGDPIEILGIGPEPANLPSLGQVTRITADAIVYKPFDADWAVGTDRFTYRVRDSYGAEGTGRIEVGIVPLPETNGAPVAVNDEYSVPLGATVPLWPLLNDSDPEDDPLRILEEGFTAPTVGSAEVTADGQGIRFEAPNSEEIIIFGYTISDPGSATSAATIQVTVAEHVENAPPVAQDDIMEPTRAGTQVVVPVLDNDVDPDGVVSDLIVEVIGFPSATVGVDNSITFEMPSHGVTFAYSITDPLDETLTSIAFVQVPLASNRPPVVASKEVTVGYNETIQVDALGLATDPDGDELTIVPDSVKPLRGSGTVAVDGGIVTFNPGDRFSGLGGFSFEVTDGEWVAAGSVNILVEDSGNEPPTFRTTTVEVPAAGERTFELRPNVVDPGDAGHVFGDLNRSQVPEGMNVSLSSGGTLVVSSPDPTSKGTSGRITFSIDDGKERGIGEGAVNIEVIASDKPLPGARPDTSATDPRLGDIREGQTNIVLHVLDNDFDPFQDGSLRITYYGPLTPASAGTLPEPPSSDDSTTILFTPAESFYGTATIPYTIIDRTGDPDRSSTSTVTVTIKGRPDAPGTPTATAESRQVNLTWPVPDERGAPITEYQVMDIDTQQVVQTVNTNSALIPNLVNGTDYQFQVRAINEVGEGPWSDPSPSVRPNQAPDTPASPTTQFGDGEIAVTWQLPNNEGSAITGYELRILPLGQVYQAGANELSHTWLGLTNGDPYQFEVRARNVDFESEWSSASGQEIPAGVPQNIAAPNPPQAGDRIVNVTWDEPFPNGDAIDRYEIYVFENGGQVHSETLNDPGNRSYTYNNANNGSRYSFAVRAENKAGWSGTSTESTDAIPSGVPFGVTTVSASEGDRSAVLSWTAPGDNGAAISGFEVAVDTASNPLSFQSLAGNVVTGLSNGTDYFFRIRACNINGCSDELSPVVTTNPCTSPSAPVVNGQYFTTPRINWTWSQPNNGGRPIVDYTLTGALNRTTIHNSTNHEPVNYNTTYTLTIRANNTCPVASTSQPGSDSVTTGPPPIPPYYTVTTSPYRSCPQDQFTTSYYSASPLGCSASIGWVPRNTNIRVVCKYDPPGGWDPDGEAWWLRMYDESGWYVSAYAIDYSAVRTC